jgi:hypothetical protein
MNAEIVATLDEKYPRPPLTPELELVVEQFLSLPEEAQRQFFTDYFAKAGITDQDIEDGMVPGIRVPKE